MKGEILTTDTEPNDGQDNRDLYYALFSKVLDMQIENYYKTEKGRKLKEQIDFNKQEEINLMFKHEKQYINS